MALLPYILNYERPRRLRDQLFGLSLSPDDSLTDILDVPSLITRHYIRPWRRMGSGKDEGSTIKLDKDKFQVNLDVQHFAPEEISVKTTDGYVIIEGKHEEKKDDHGFISRQFKRRYALPEGCDPEEVHSKLSSDGVLSIIAPRQSIEGQRTVPITHTGPVRRSYSQENGEEALENNKDEEMSSPQPQKKKTRR